MPLGQHAPQGDLERPGRARAVGEQRRERELKREGQAETRARAVRVDAHESEGALREHVFAVVAEPRIEPVLLPRPVEEPDEPMVKDVVERREVAVAVLQIADDFFGHPRGQG